MKNEGERTKYLHAYEILRFKHFCLVIPVELHQQFICLSTVSLDLCGFDVRYGCNV